MKSRDNTDPGKNDAFIQMIRQAEEIWNDYKALKYQPNKNATRQIDQLEKKVEKLQQINWKQEFELIRKIYK